MAQLIGGVDSAKAGAQRQFCKCGGRIFLPGCAVEQIWNRRKRFGHNSILSRSEVRDHHGGTRGVCYTTRFMAAAAVTVTSKRAPH